MAIKEHSFKSPMERLDAKRVLLSLYFEFKGDQNKIYEFISKRMDCISLYKKYEKKTAKCINDYLWYYDDEYPEEYKILMKPPLIVPKKKLKTYKFRFVAYTDIEIRAGSYKAAKYIAGAKYLDEGPDFEKTKIIHKRK